ncbi:MAG: hypothetical protein AB7O31_13460 [Burkholderiales bacterium]
MSASTAEALAQLAAGQREILAEIRALRADVRAMAERGRRRHRPADHGEHLRAIAAVVGSRLFSVNELLRHATLTDDGELRGALVGIAGALNGRRIGKVLREVEGQNIDGLRIERVGEDRQGITWTLRVCGDETGKTALPVASIVRLRR